MKPPKNEGHVMTSAVRNWNPVTDAISVGACPTTTQDLDQIVSESGCTAVLCLQSDEDLEHNKIDWYELESHASEQLNVKMLRIPMRDFDPDDQRKALGEAIHGLASLVREGRKVYVHCTAGMNRSPLVVLGYLTFCDGMPLDEANRLLVKRHSPAAPPLDVWRAARRELLDRHEKEILADCGTSELNSARQDSERRILRRIFLPGS